MLNVKSGVCCYRIRVLEESERVGIKEKQNPKIPKPEVPPDEDA